MRSHASTGLGTRSHTPGAGSLPASMHAVWAQGPGGLPPPLWGMDPERPPSHIAPVGARPAAMPAASHHEKASPYSPRPTASDPPGLPPHISMLFNWHLATIWHDVLIQLRSICTLPQRPSTCCNWRLAPTLRRMSTPSPRRGAAAYPPVAAAVSLVMSSFRDHVLFEA